MYQWNKFRSFLERNFRSFSADWESRMVKEFRNSTEDSSEGGLGHCKGACPLSAPSRDTGESGGDGSHFKEDPEEDPKEDIDGTETRNRV